MQPAFKSLTQTLAYLLINCGLSVCSRVRFCVALVFVYNCDFVQMVNSHQTRAMETKLKLIVSNEMYYEMLFTPRKV